MKKIRLYCLIALILSSIFIYSGCSTQSQLTYLNNLDTAEEKKFYPLVRPDYKIQKQDILYVNITTMNQELNDILNPVSNTSSLYREESAIFIYGYTVNDSGYISLPMIGEIYVYNKTIEELKSAVFNRAKEYLKDPIINVRLLTFKFTVIGEVNLPGTFTNYNNQLTVLEAIGRAGDITDFGNREKVLVLRPQKEGTYTYQINLQDKNLLQSEGYFLLPNDIVIVEPIKRKPFQLNIPTYSLIITTSISTISTLILLVNFLNTN